MTLEIIARALCEDRIRTVRRFDTDPKKLEEMLPASIDMNWPEYIPPATTIAFALAKAGMAIVPMEPTQNMVSAGIAERHDQPTPEAWSKATESIYRAMIDAAPYPALTPKSA